MRRMATETKGPGIRHRLLVGVAAIGAIVGVFAGARAAAPHGGGARRAEPEATDALGGYLWRRHALLSEDGTIRADGLRNALRQRAEMVAARSADKAIAGVDRTLWVNRGPQNVGGRVRSLLIHPMQPQRMWAGSVSGGIFETSDGGAHWSPVDDFLPNLAVSTMAMDPTRPQVMYAGTGEGFFPSDAVSGLGVFKSSDGGKTWSLLPASATSTSRVNRVAVSPDGKVLLVAGYLDSADGIFRSTNGGATLTRVFAAGYPFDVVFHPTDPHQALATYSTYEPASRETFHRVLWSVDGGQTWHRAGGLDVPDWLSRIEVAYAPSSPSVVYAGTSGQLFKSTDGGHNFAKLTDIDGPSWYTNSIWVAPDDPDLVVVGGGGLSRSSDGGRTFERIGDGYLLAEDPHPDHHLMVAAPGYGATNHRVYDTDDGGIFRTEDIRAVGQNGGWVSLVEGLQTTQFYAAAGDGARGLLVGGTQDNGTLRVDLGSTRGSLVYGGDGGQVAIDWQDPRYCYGEYVGLRVFRSTDGCLSWSGDLDNLPDYGVGNFIAPLVVDPSNPRRLYAGGKSLWRTDDARADVPVWVEVRKPGSDNVLAIAVAPSDPNVVWITQNDSKVYRTTNALSAAPRWTTVDDNQGIDPLPERWMPHLLVDRQNPAKAWIGLGGYEDRNLWRTTDGGATWKDVSGSHATGLPFVGVRAIAQHPRLLDWLYVATDVGIFASEDGGASWATSNAGPANVSTDDLAFLHGSSTLLAATHGRGLWTVDTDAFAPGVPCVAGSEALCLSAGRFRVFATYRTGDGRRGVASAVRLTDDTGYFWFFGSGNVELAVKVLDACSFNHRFWTFAGGLTDVEVTLYVVDSRTGAMRTYVNPQGHAFEPIQDTGAFTTCEAGGGGATPKTRATVSPAPARELPGPGDVAPAAMRPADAAAASMARSGRQSLAAPGCGGTPDDLCLSGGRFRASVTWRMPDGRTGHGKGVAITGDTGYFWFFDAGNVEALVKVLDACGLNSGYWVFAGGLTGVELTLQVTDTVTGASRQYTNPQGVAFRPIQDTDALATCP